MERSTIQLEVVSPDRKVLEASVEEVVLPAQEGYLGVLPGHTPLLTAVGIGELSYVQGGRTHFMALAQGFAEVLPDRVIVLCKSGEKLEEIDLARAEASRTEAGRVLSLAGDTWDKAFRRAEVRMARALNRITIARRHTSG